jgi:hypothetical protein
MLMPTTLAETGLSFQPKPPTGGAERQRSAVRREAVRPQNRISQTKKADDPPIISTLKAPLFFNFATDFACVSHEKPRISF